MKRPFQIPSTAECEGMSEPIFFAFDTLEGNRVLAHAVIFTSFKVSDDCVMQIGGLESDTRMAAFVRYAVENFYGDVTRKGLEEHILKKSQEIDAQMQLLKELKEQVRLLKAKLGQ